MASSSVHAQSLHYSYDDKRLQGTGPDTALARLDAPFRRSKRPRDSRGRRNVILTAALIGAMLFGGIFIVCMVGILGMGMEMVLRR